MAPNTAVQVVNQESFITDFPFIAHDGATKTRRQIPTFVRAHVMERYHRERRAKKGIVDSFNPVWSQYESIEPLGASQTLKWEQEHPVRRKQTTKPQNKKKSSTSPPKLKTTPPGNTNVKKEPPSEGSDEERIAFYTPYNAKTKQDGDHLLREMACSVGFNPLGPMEQKAAQLISVMEDYYHFEPTVNKRSMDIWRQVWMPFAFSDPVLFHASLAKFSMHAAATRGTVTIKDTELLQHKGLAMKEMSKRLETKKVTPTDQMIGAALCLVGTEMFNHDWVAFMAHIRGLRQMVAARGGVQQLGHDGIMMAAYVTYEYVIAIMADELGEDVEDCSLRWLGVPPLKAANFPSATGIFTLKRTVVDPTKEGFSEETVLFLSSLCNYLCISDVFADATGFDGKSRRCLQTLIRVFRVQNIRESSHKTDQGGKVEGPALEVDHVLQALILAALIQFPHLHDTSARTQYLTVPEKLLHLQYHLSKTPIASYWLPIPGALIWCLLVGLRASTRTYFRPWFIANMVRCASGLAFENPEGIRVALETFQRLHNQQTSGDFGARVDEVLETELPIRSEAPNPPFL